MVDRFQRRSSCPSSPCARFPSCWASRAIIPVANAEPVRITEWEYNGGGTSAEFIEFTNLGTTAVDFTGWSFDDDSNTPGTVSLTGFGIVAPGESVLLVENTNTAQFLSNWGLSSTVKIIGGNAANLGRNDRINLYDNNGVLIDTLSYGDQNFPGTIRTDGKSGLPTLAALGTDNAALWFFAALGDAYGSHANSSGNIGNPGIYLGPNPSAVPLPAAAWLLVSGIGALGALGRRRRLLLPEGCGQCANHAWQCCSLRHWRLHSRMRTAEPRQLRAFLYAYAERQPLRVHQQTSSRRSPGTGTRHPVLGGGRGPVSVRVRYGRHLPQPDGASRVSMTRRRWPMWAMASSWWDRSVCRTCSASRTPPVARYR